MKCFQAQLLVAVLGIGGTLVPAWAEELEIVGTGDGIEILQAVGALFNAEHSTPTVAIPPSIGSGGAIAAVGSERHSMGRVARPLSDQERAQGLVAVPMVKIPSAFFVNPAAGVASLSAAQITDIYAGRIDNWREVGGADLKIKVVRREDTDSTLGVLRASLPGWKDLALTTRSKLSTTTQDAVETVKQTAGAVGFGPYSRSLENGTTVLSIDGRHPRDDGYPSAVTVALLYKEGRLGEGPKELMAFLKTTKAQNAMMQLGGIPVSP